MNNREYEKQLTEKMDRIKNEVHNIYCKLRTREGRDTFSYQSMMNTIGSKNATFTDCVNMEFMTPNIFIAEWLKGLCDEYGEKEYEGPNGTYRYILIEMMRYPICKEFILLFLERNFYRNYYERVRYKPSASLWEVWFGSNPLFWGIMLSPAFRNGKWTNDVSEIRRADYEYWTIGHVLKTGIVAPNSSEPFRFHSIDEFITFYKQILMRISNSKYEQELMQYYFDYILSQENANKVPLLIPEFRFYKEEKDHKYRLDFTVLNAYTREAVGFEISPQSTHMSVSGIKRDGKTQTEINSEIGEKWEKEMDKRNEYFSQYGISVITFTDKHLQDIEACFEVIKGYLEERGIPAANYDEQEERLEKILDRIK